MKLLHLTFHFEYREAIEKILDEQGVQNYVVYPMMEGKDIDGKHFGSKIHPGNVSVIEAQVEEDQIEQLFEKLSEFKHAKRSRYHLEALILPIERKIEREIKLEREE